MEVHMKQRCGIEFLHAEKMAPTDTYRDLLKVFEDQLVDVSTVRWCISAAMTVASFILFIYFYNCSMVALVHRWQKSSECS